VIVAVCSELVKDYRSTVKHIRELEQNIKAEKYKITKTDSSTSDRLT